MPCASTLFVARGDPMSKPDNLVGSRLCRSQVAIFVICIVGCLSVVSAAGLLVEPVAAQTASQQYPALPNETPAKFEPKTDSFEYIRREVMIPMRDGVKLHTVILVPKGAKDAPILLTRTPYDADALTNHATSTHLGPTLSGYDNATEVIVEG